ncbi:2'-5' RNA ligase [Marinobacter daqiaonensis]|uniref:RNA 2',3'-cyclic phosphodiesterase n=1 Tax=Marinobacter daqiaonensis TaxID=650891 RepID=A0A1I6JC33_9GAMM|nr:RNA 2',3'-cyclic phosphodiesterase [Marinobacter daqiaonensis]SFR76080.1 2'-5' RNA ligase [Marinobacter daqiaonensis]
MPRLFFGLELPEECKGILLDLACGIPGARWQSRDQLHLTLLFLGQVEPERVPSVVTGMDGLPLEAFSLRLRGTGCFGDPEKPRNLWAGVAPEAPVAALHQEVDRRMQGCGFAPETRDFRPHVTLARFGRRKAGSVAAFLDRNQALSTPSFIISSVSLFASTPGKEGSRYEVFARFPLTRSQES